jgi:hypothetical protein
MPKLIGEIADRATSFPSGARHQMHFRHRMYFRHQMYFAASAIRTSTTITSAAICTQRLLAKPLLLSARVSMCDHLPAIPLSKGEPANHRVAFASSSFFARRPLCTATYFCPAYRAPTKNSGLFRSSIVFEVTLCSYPSAQLKFAFQMILRWTTMPLPPTKFR